MDKAFYFDKVKNAMIIIGSKAGTYDQQ